MNSYVITSGLLCAMGLCMASRIAIGSAGLDELSPGNWMEVENTWMEQVAPDSLPPGSHSIYGVIRSWGSGAYDTKRDRLIVWGGGHGDYSGNEVYVFDVNEAKWHRLNNPTYQVGGDDKNGLYNDGTPRSAHTYNYLQYAGQIDRFCTIRSAATYPSGNGSLPNVFTFDLENLEWESRSNYPGAGYTIGSFTAVHPQTGDIWYHTTGSNGQLSKWNPEEDSWELHAQFNGGWMPYYLTADIFENQLVAVGKGNLWVWDLGQPDSPHQVIDSKGPQDIVNAQAPGFVFCPKIKKFVAWNGGQRVFTLDPETWTWSTELGLGPDPGEATKNGVNGRFRYVPSKDAFILVTDHQKNVFFYKLSDDMVVQDSVQTPWQVDKVITQLTVREVDGTDAEKYPLTFGLPFEKSTIFPEHDSLAIRIGDQIIDAQFDAKTTWEDGSLKHGIFSVIIPQITAFSKVDLQVVKGPGTTQIRSYQKSDKAELNAWDLEMELQLHSESFGSVDAYWSNSISTSKEWLSGSTCKSVLSTQRLSEGIFVSWETVRYQHTNYGFKVTLILEHNDYHKLSSFDYETILLGAGAIPDTLLVIPTTSHAYGSRWKKTIWIGERPGEVDVQYDLSYLQSTGMVPPYDERLQVEEALISSLYDKWVGTDDVNGNGFLNKNFGTTGARDELGLLPTWAVQYLLTFDHRLREIVEGHGEISGHLPIHYKVFDTEDDPFGRIITIDRFPQVETTSEGYFSGDNNANGWSLDLAHQPSLAYLPYLLTGEHYYLDEVKYWAAYCLNYNPYRREGSEGYLYNQMRGVAWGLRNIGHAASILPDMDWESGYFKEKLQNNLDDIYQRNFVDNHVELGYFLNRRENGDGAPYNGGFLRGIAPWQHDFMVIVLAELNRHDFTLAGEIHDHLARFTIGRFHGTAFPRYAGAGYWWPLRDANLSLVSPSDWQGYWNAVKQYEGRDDDYEPNLDSFLQRDYPESYAYVARAALACAAHLENGTEAFEFLDQTLSTTSGFAKNPIWALNSNTSKLLTFQSESMAKGASMTANWNGRQLIVQSDNISPGDVFLVDLLGQEIPFSIQGRSAREITLTVPAYYHGAVLVGMASAESTMGKIVIID